MLATKRDFIRFTIRAVYELDVLRSSLAELLDSLPPSEVSFLTDKEKKALEIVRENIKPKEVKQLEDYTRNQLVFSYYRMGMSHSQIAEEMSKTQFLPKQGGEWTRYVVKGIVSRLKEKGT